MKSKESGSGPAVNFLGRMTLEQPEVVSTINPRERYILFSHADRRNQRTYEDLAQTFGISSARVGQLFHKTLTNIYEEASPSLKETYNLDTIIAAAAGKNASRIKLKNNPSHPGEGLVSQPRRRLSPETREKISQKARKRIALLNGLVSSGVDELAEESYMEEIDPDDQSLWNYAQEHGFIAIIKERDLMSPEDLDALSRSFEEGFATKLTDDLLNKFSLLVAQLA